MAAGIGLLTLAPLALGVCLAVLAAGGGVAALVPLLLAAGLVVAGRRSLDLACRHRVGADAERAVRRTLDALRRDRWNVRHAVHWPGGGDIDHLVRSPHGRGFAVETKTQGFTDEHLRRTLHTARWAAGKRRRFPLGVVPVLCVVRSRQLEHRYGDVLVVSLDRLLPALRRLEGTS
jgi:hypothetical protein